MPTYDYVCTRCGHAFEEFQKMTDTPLTECPSCHDQTLKRMIGTGAGMIFKGSGFYLTDYKNKGQSATSRSVSKSASSASPPEKGDTTAGAGTAGSKPSSD